MDDDLRKLLERILGDIASSIDAYRAGRLPLPSWRAQMAKTIGDGHRAAFLLGADTRELSPQARNYLARTIADQLGYLKGFVTDVRAGRVGDAMMAARAALYAGALKATFSRAKWWDWPLPFHPTVDCICHTVCGCKWDGRDLDHEKLDGNFYWILTPHPHTDHCPTCIDRYNKGEPYLVRGGTLQ